VAGDPDRPNEGAWSDLERGFFAAAPPDVPVPPPEPMRFDDLDPIAPPRPDWRARLSHAWARTAAARRALRSGTSALSAATRVAIRGGRVQVGRLAAAFRSTSRDRRLIAAAAVTLVVVMGVSAGVVASRGGARPTLGSDRVDIGAGSAVVSEATLTPPAPVAPPERDMRASSASIPPEASPPPHRKRKHVKRPTRHSMQTKAAGKHAPRSVGKSALRR
jgi:hypothetical protein